MEGARVNVGLMEAVERASGRKEKETLLRDADATTKQAIKFALDPFMTYGVTVDSSSVSVGIDPLLAEADARLFGDTSPSKSRQPNPSKWWESGFSLLRKLAKRDLTGHAAQRNVQSWVESAPDSLHAKWGVRVLHKDLRCGVSQETVVKLWPMLIEPFRVSLAHPYDPSKHGDDLCPGWLEPKLDGLRMVIVDGEAFTRNGKPIHNVEHIVDRIRQAGLLYDWVWDGECLAPGTTFEETVGLLRKAKGVDGSSLVFHPFDVVDRASWRARDTLSTDDRKADLRALASKIRSPSISPILGRRVEHPTRDLLVDARDRYMRSGLEGAMFKRADAPYEFKRSDAVLKVKLFHTMDVKIVGANEGAGKLEGMLGALVVEIDGVQFHVGSGYSEVERQELWAIREHLIGRTVEVKYQNRTAKGKGRFPTYIRMRPDKDTR
jgi:DNA ligase 1